MTDGPGVRLRDSLLARRSDGFPHLVPYVTAGYPEHDDTASILLAVEGAGCSAVEVGIPFSDPLADGPAIQHSSQHALNNGMRPRVALDQVAAARAAGLTIPVAVMTYVNVILAMEPTAFARRAREVGIDAAIVPDLPLGEADILRTPLHAEGIALVPLVAPTTPDHRLEQACATGAGFVYCVAVVGTTGARDHVAEDALTLLDRVRRYTDLPRALGFGLSRREHLDAVRGHAEAAVVGSALMTALAGGSETAPRIVGRFLREMQPAT